MIPNPVCPNPTPTGVIMRVAIISPNIVVNVDDHNKMVEDPNRPWPLDSLAKKVSLLFDKIYLTHDLDLTCNIVESISGEFEKDPLSGTLRYLADEGLLLKPQDLGYSSGDQFLKANIKGVAAELHKELLRIGNPDLEDDPHGTLVGQPDVGDFAAHDGVHPRLNRKQLAGMSLREQQQRYESILLRRNAAMLRQAGTIDASVVGRLFEESGEREYLNPVWKVVLKEMPQLDTTASWADVLAFRREEHTQHLIRSFRRWVRKAVAEEWTEAELEDEVRELMYEYENHLRIARMSAQKGFLEFLITGAADLFENIVKLRFSKIGELASVMRNRKVKLLEEEASAPGREIALMTEMKKRF
jgi:hypothetical protein